MKPVSIFALVLAIAVAGCATDKTNPDNAQASPTERCKATSVQEIAEFFDRGNKPRQTAPPRKVVPNHPKRSILPPTVSNTPRLTPKEKEDYFQHFLKNRPFGKIDMR